MGGYGTRREEPAQNVTFQSVLLRQPHNHSTSVVLPQKENTISPSSCGQSRAHFSVD